MSAKTVKDGDSTSRRGGMRHMTASALTLAVAVSIVLSAAFGGGAGIPRVRATLVPSCAAAQGSTQHGGLPDKAGGAGDKAKVKVAVSILPQAFFVERIGGNRVEVSVMVPPGASPHTYEPTPSQMRDLARTQMYVRVRVDFEEAWMPRISAANRDMLVVDSTKGLSLSDDSDPHVWLSPRLVRVQAEHICRGLAEVDPAGSGVYEGNKQAFLRELESLDEEIAGILAKVRGRRFMVLHPAWGYFAADYGLEELPIEVDGKEPSARELSALVEAAKADRIRVVFVQPQSSPRVAEVLAQQIGARVATLDPLARDWAGNLRKVAKALAEALAH